jgi:CHAT domain-containing protein
MNKLISLIFIAIVSLSTNCAAQKFSKIIAEVERLDSLEEYQAALDLVEKAWKKAGNNQEKQMEVLCQKVKIFNNLAQLGLSDSLCAIAISIYENPKNTIKKTHLVSFLKYSALAKGSFNDHETALLLIEKALENSEKESIDYVYSLGAKGYLLNKKGETKEALHVLQTCYETIKRKNIKGIETEGIRVLYAGLICNTGNINLCKQISEEVIQEISDKNDKTSQTLGAAYYYLSVVYNKLGDFNKDLFYAKKATYIVGAKKNSVDFCIGLFNIASTYILKTSEIDSSIHYINLFKETGKAVENATFQIQYRIYSNQLDAFFYDRIGDFDIAIIAGQKTLDFLDKNDLKIQYSLDYLNAVNSISTSHLNMKNYEKALTFSKKAIELQVLTANGNILPTLYLNLSKVYDNLKQYDSAFIAAQKGIEISESKYGKESSQHIYNLQALGISYFKLKQNKEAVPLFKQGLAESQRQLGSNTERTIRYTTNLLNAYRTIQQKDSTLLLHTNLHYSLSGVYQKSLPSLSQRNRADFIKKFETSNNVIFSNTLDNPFLNLTQTAYNHALLTKGIVLSYTQAWKKQLENTTNLPLKTLYNEWLTNKSFISKQYEIPIAKRNPKLDSLETSTEQQESQLNQQSAAFRQANEQVNWQQVQSTLKEGEAAIEYIHFQYHNGFELTDSTMYCAMIIRKGDVAPTFLTIFEEKTLDAILAKKAGAYSYLPNDTYKAIWQPLEPYLKGVNTIYYSPSGKLELISFDAICYQYEKYLCQRYTSLRRLRSTRELVLGLQNESLNLSASSRSLFLGDMQYGGNQGISAISSGKLEGADDKNCSFNQLENGAVVYNIVDSLTSQYHLVNLNKRQWEGSEDYFKNTIHQSNTSPEIMLFFTHGFYKDKPNYSSNCALLAIKEPLFRSGLALANANLAWCEGKTANGKEDGLLTAYEISNMDLSNTQLVILAACQSGVGDLQGSEGVSGLQKAFKMANAKSLLVALWDLDAGFAAEFTERFYEYVLKGKSPHAAFKMTQEEIIKMGKYGERVWGAFVLVE